MRKVSLFIAMSLDGYIADRQGNVDWLKGHEEPENRENEDSYSSFIKEVDTVIMGWNTYHQIVTELSPKVWVYEDLKSYVITHHEMPSTEKIQFTDESPCELVDKLKKKDGKTIWICGGASIIQPLIKENLIDEYRISVIPAILGSGIRLFGEFSRETLLKLERTESDNGIVELIYTRR